MSQLVNFSDSSKTHQLFTWLRDAVVASASLQTFIALLYNSDFSLLGRSTPSVQPINFFSLLYQSSALSSRAVDGHQMYFRGSIVAKTSTIGIQISPTPPLIFTGGESKTAKFGGV